MILSGDNDCQILTGHILVEVEKGIYFRVYDEFNPHIVADRIKKVDDFGMEKIINRYMRDYGVSFKTAEIYQYELKKFLLLSAIFNEDIGMHGEVDNLWHTFLLFTREYIDFCYLVAGNGIIIHHTPNIETDNKSILCVDEIGMAHDYLTFWRAYKFIFGVFPPAAVWPQ